MLTAGGSTATGGCMQTLRNSEQVTHSLMLHFACAMGKNPCVRIVAGVRVNVDLAVSPVSWLFNWIYVKFCDPNLVSPNVVHPSTATRLCFHKHEMFKHFSTFLFLSQGISKFCQNIDDKFIEVSSSLCGHKLMTNVENCATKIWSLSDQIGKYL